MSEFIHHLFEAGIHWQLINFAIFLGILYVTLKKPVREFWTSRAHEIRFQIEESAVKAAEAKKKIEAANARISGIEREAEQLVRGLETEGNEEKQKLIEGAEKLSQRITSDREKMIVQEIRKARESLKAQVIQLSIEMAEKSIVENVGDEDQRRLSDQYLSEVERGAV